MLLWTKFFLSPTNFNIKQFNMLMYCFWSAYSHVVLWSCLFIVSFRKSWSTPLRFADSVEEIVILGDALAFSETQWISPLQPFSDFDLIKFLHGVRSLKLFVSLRTDVSKGNGCISFVRYIPAKVVAKTPANARLFGTRAMPCCRRVFVTAAAHRQPSVDHTAFRYKMIGRHHVAKSAQKHCPFCHIKRRELWTAQARC